MPRISPRVFAPARLNLRTIQAPARRTKLEEDSYQHLYFAQVGTSSRINVRVKGGAQGVTPPTLKRGPSTALCRMRVRSGHNRKFFRPLRRRVRRYGSGSGGKQAPAR